MIETVVLFVALLLADPWPLSANVDGGRVRDPQDPSPALGATLPAPRRDVLTRVCASSFGAGDLARVEIFRTKTGAVAVLALRPDITRFTHAPHTFYGPDGVELLVVPERPVVPGDAASEAVGRKLAALLRDLRASSSEFCSKHR